MLVKRICSLCASDKFVLRGESNWVLSNAISQICDFGKDFGHLNYIWDLYHDHLLFSLKKNLDEFLGRGNQEELISNMLDAIEYLLKLD
jgi:hypothetical protein